MKRTATLFLGLSIILMTTHTAQAVSAYNSIPSPLPGNVISLGYEATSAAEAGDHIAFAGGGGLLGHVTVVLSSWGCQSGHWFSADCTTTPGSGFTHPLTLNLYAVDHSGADPAPGPLIATLTQSFFIPYRPSVDPINCTGGRWYNGTTCFNGYATPATFNFSALGITLPSEVIYGLAYNTTHYGASPIGEAATCYASSGGCGYDSLNFGPVGNIANGQPSIGTDVEDDTVFWNTTFAGFYCDSGAGGTGTFRRDAFCWPDPASTFAVAFALNDFPFRDVRRPSDINIGPDVIGTGHTAINFTGAIGPQGDSWITVYDVTPENPDQTLFTGSVKLSLDVAIKNYNNVKGAGLLALYNEGPGKKGLALVLINAGNSDALMLYVVDNAGGAAILKTLYLASKVQEKKWYRVTMEVTVSGGNFSVVGKAYSHAIPSNPDSIATTLLGTLIQPATSLASKGLSATGEIGIIARAVSASADSSATNFEILP